MGDGLVDVHVSPRCVGSLDVMEVSSTKQLAAAWVANRLVGTCVTNQTGIQR